MDKVLLDIRQFGCQTLKMVEESLHIEQIPELHNPVFIAGFDGWGNALDISRGMVDYLIRKLKATYIGRINPDLFYRFDENRPMVNIKDGLLMKISPPGMFSLPSSMQDLEP